RRRLHDEGEAAVAVHRDHYRGRQALLQGLGLRIEGLAELHDVHALLAQGRAHRRTGISLACRDLQLDVSGDFLCHARLLLWVDNAPLPESSPRLCASRNLSMRFAQPFNGVEATPSEKN